MTSKRLLTITQFSDRYSISRSSVYREVGAKRLKFTKVGKRTLIAVDDAEQWLAKLREADDEAA